MCLSRDVCREERDKSGEECGGLHVEPERLGQDCSLKMGRANATHIYAAAVMVRVDFFVLAGQASGESEYSGEDPSIGSG